jgi:hypothetical protein
VPVEWHGELALRPQGMITATIDHRFIERGPTSREGRLVDFLQEGASATRWRSRRESLHGGVRAILRIQGYEPAFARTRPTALVRELPRRSWRNESRWRWSRVQTKTKNESHVDHVALDE